MDEHIEGATYHVEILNSGQSRTVVFLHGFTGSSSTWNEIAEALPDYRIVLIDLLGHGKTSSPAHASRYAMELQVRDLKKLVDKLGITDYALAGYSMGGRTALAYAVAFPEHVRLLILESASPGLKTTAEQLERQRRDEKLAERILSNGIFEFVEFWEKTPLFDSQKNLSDKVRERIRHERIAQKPLGLANSLIGMGTGSQASYWEGLDGLDLPVLLVAGTLDLKFMEIAKRMAERLPSATFSSIEAGHAIHVEKPAEFATIVREYLSSNY
ncbi:MAG TPA: 2-succinyl-6-hydroxy-2,4-cyclohexadiene-1-carboxylate synthase [Planococcus sp. (in: firmicutes)]|nr:2-succinyl-6-hydroxy-2,4-cyclohexadiene-1-carboxylate synthase [Planococcus sp. (in: firmicutes)]